MSKNTKNDEKIKYLKRRQALLRANNTDHSWTNILEDADLNYTATMQQLQTGSISEEKLQKIEQAISRREVMPA